MAKAEVAAVAQAAQTLSAEERVDQLFAEVAARNANRRTLTQWFGDKIDGVAQETARIVGVTSQAASGMSEAFDIGTVEGSIKHAHRMDQMRAESKARILELVSR